jgi:hypothetical protein
MKSALSVDMNARLNAEPMLRRSRRQELADARDQGRSKYSVPKYPVNPRRHGRLHPAIDVIFRAMNAKRITYDEFSEKSGVSKTTLDEWRYGRQRRARARRYMPSLETLDRAYKALGIRMRLFVDGLDD